jgi:hypothetical protein
MCPATFPDAGIWTNLVDRGFEQRNEAASTDPSLASDSSARGCLPEGLRALGSMPWSGFPFRASLTTNRQKTWGNNPPRGF